MTQIADHDTDTEMVEEQVPTVFDFFHFDGKPGVKNELIGVAQVIEKTGTGKNGKPWSLLIVKMRYEQMRLNEDGVEVTDRLAIEYTRFRDSHDEMVYEMEKEKWMAVNKRVVSVTFMNGVDTSAWNKDATVWYWTIKAGIITFNEDDTTRLLLEETNKKLKQVEAMIARLEAAFQAVNIDLNDYMQESEQVVQQQKEDTPF